MQWMQCCTLCVHHMRAALCLFLLRSHFLSIKSTHKSHLTLSSKFFNCRKGVKSQQQQRQVKILTNKVLAIHLSAAAAAAKKGSKFVSILCTGSIYYILINIHMHSLTPNQAVNYVVKMHITQDFSALHLLAEVYFQGQLVSNFAPRLLPLFQLYTNSRIIFGCFFIWWQCWLQQQQ